jgi:NTE family protein
VVDHLFVEEINMKNLKFTTLLFLLAISTNSLIANTQTETQRGSENIILVLGSGGSRGLAHVGVIEELEKLGIVPDAIVGCSSGAIVGALYAQHRDIAKVKEILINLKQDDIIDFNLFQKHALSTRNKFEEFLQNNLIANEFSALQIPFVAVVTDLHKGEPVYLQQGELHPALLASAALPGLFPPYYMKEHVYVDGGLCDPLPVHFAHTWKNGIVIASDISLLLGGFDAENLLQVLRKSFEVAYKRLAYTSQQEADILLEMNFRDIDSPIEENFNPKIYEEGKKAVRDHSEEIMQKIFKK